MSIDHLHPHSNNICLFDELSGSALFDNPASKCITFTHFLAESFILFFRTEKRICGIQAVLVRFKLNN